MGLPLRLFIILAVLFLVIPAIFKKSNPESGVIQAEAIQAQRSQAPSTNNQKLSPSSKTSNYGEQLKASITKLRLSDEGLENCVTQSLSNYFALTDGSRHIQDAADITHLSCHRSGIKSLRGIRALTKLTSISLSDEDFVDVSPLSSIGTLETINLGNASNKIENIDSLKSLNNLTSIKFPNLEVAFCYEAEKVIKNMEWNHDRVKHNLNQIRCRGKQTDTVNRALKKQQQNKELSETETRLLEDYKENERWK